MKNLYAALLMLNTALILFAVSSCGAKKTVKVKVQLMDAATHAGYVDYYLQGSKAAQLIGMAQGSNSNTAELAPVDPLIIEIKNPNTGATLVSASYAYWQQTTHYSFVIYGDTGALKYALLSDTVAWPAAGHFKVRFSHFTADAPALDVFYNNDTVAFNKVYYGTDSTQAVGDFKDLPAGTYTVRVKDHNTGQTYLIQPNIGIQDNRILDVFTTGLMTDSTYAFFQLGGVAH